MRTIGEGIMRRKERIRRIATTAGLTLLVGAAMLFTRGSSVSAHFVPQPCDFTTGGGFVITDNGEHANFGLVGGCKHEGFFGHVNFVDHDTVGPFAGLHVSSTSITGYFVSSPDERYRDICGTANTNLFGPVYFRVRTLDDGEPGSGPEGPDRFGIKIANDFAEAVVVTTRFLAGGNIQLHKPNPSTTGPNPPPDEFTACHMSGDDMGY